MTIECCKKISFLFKTSCFLKLILNTIWISIISAIIFFIMMKYTLPIMIQDLWEENYSIIKKELGKKLNLLQPEDLPKDLKKHIEKIKNNFHKEK